MNGRNQLLRPAVWEEFSALGSDSKLWAHQRLGGGGPETHYQLRFDRGQFGLEPWFASRNLDPARLGMNAPLATFEKLEVLHSVRDINLLPIEPGFMHGFAQESPGGADKGEPFAVFFIARLFADHHNSCVLRSCAEDHLGGILIEVASPASG